MLGAFLKNIAKRERATPPLRLHIGGKARVDGWHILDVQPGEHVDFVGSCSDLGRFSDRSISEIYASHVLEHLSYQFDLHRALTEFARVLVPGGVLRVSVPDLTTLCELFLDPALTRDERFHVMRSMFGGQMDKADYHFVGLSHEFLADYLAATGFVDVARIDDHSLFDDCSRLTFKGRRISLNVVARKPAASASA